MPELASLSMDQLKGFTDVLTYTVISNVAVIIGGLFQFYWFVKKMRQDINVAHYRITKVEEHVGLTKNIPLEVYNGDSHEPIKKTADKA